jgi:hypothetical protein
VFHGRILLPSDYPFKPPSFMMQTVRHRPTYDVSQKSARSLQLHQTGTTFGPGRWFSCVETHTTSSHPLSPALTRQPSQSSLLRLRALSPFVFPGADGAAAAKIRSPTGASRWAPSCACPLASTTRSTGSRAGACARRSWRSSLSCPARPTAPSAGSTTRRKNAARWPRSPAPTRPKWCVPSVYDT